MLDECVLIILYPALLYIEISVPTPVQKATIPRLLNGENLVMAASTGSGKSTSVSYSNISILINSFSNSHMSFASPSPIYMQLLWLGKTLAYLLPTVQTLQAQEVGGYQRHSKRPRCLILVPTRELARQVLVNVKSLSHFCKMSSCAVLGGEEFAVQKKSVSQILYLLYLTCLTVNKVNVAY